MPDAVIDQILNAEKSAAARLDASKRDAADSIAQAKADADVRIDGELKNVGRAIKAAVSKAEEKSVVIKNKHDEKALAAAEKMLREAGGRCEAAVAVVVQEIIGKWQ